MKNMIGMKKNLLTNQSIEMLRFESLDSFRNISHFITTRSGGGTDPYGAFNLCDYTGDDPEHIERCRSVMCGILNIPEDHLILPRQVHKTDVGIVEDVDFEGEYDALLTDKAGICIGVSTADCVPILLYCPQKRVVGAVHAGWRGTVGRIAMKAIRSEERRVGKEC